MVAGDRGAAEWTFRATGDDGAAFEVRGCDLFEFDGDLHPGQERLPKGARDPGLRPFASASGSNSGGSESRSMSSRSSGRASWPSSGASSRNALTSAGSKWLPLPCAISSRMRATGHGSLYGRLRAQRVVDVADGADATLERDLLACQAAGIAGAVPALVVGAGDRLGHLDERRVRAREDLGALRRVRLHDPPLVRVESAWLEQDVVRDSDLADVVECAGVAKHVRSRGVESDAQREALAEVADAVDVLARVAVA